MEDNIKEIMKIKYQKPIEPCPTCNCCSIVPYYGPNNKGGYCAGSNGTFEEHNKGIGICHELEVV